MKRLVSLLLAAVPPLAALAEADPTRPPPAYVEGAPADPAGASGSGAPALQSVILPAGGGKGAAVINGQLVRVGGRIGDSRLIRVTGNEAVLSGPQGIQRLSLTPDVEITPEKPRRAVPAGRPKKDMQ